MQKLLIPSFVFVALNVACSSGGDAPKQANNKVVDDSEKVVAKTAGHQAHEQHTEKTDKKDRETVDPDGFVRRGVALSAVTPISVSKAFGDADVLKGKSVKIEGTVESVCQAMGCWFVLQGEKPEQTIRITAKDHGFFMPKASKGKKAVIEGELAVKELDIATAKHYEEDRVAGTGEKAKDITTPAKEISVVASAVEMR